MTAGIAGLLLSVFVFLTGCGSRGMRRTIADLIGATIVFPEELQARVLDHDTVLDGNCAEPYKLVVYMNSTQCDGCRLKDLLVWKHYMRQFDSIVTPDSLRFVFIFHPKDTAVLEQQLTLYDFDRPVWVDRNGDFERMNPLPADPAFHTFLLGRDDRILLVGSPVGRPGMWKLYKESVAGSAFGK